MESFNFTTNKKIHCCFKCKDRKLHCHSTCEKYLKEKEEYVKNIKEIKNQKRKEGILASTLKQSEKNMKNNRSTNGILKQTKK